MELTTLENPPPVLSKADFVRRYALGEFGNCSPTWQRVDDLLSLAKGHPWPERVPGLYHLRNRVPGGPTHYNLHWSACVAKWIDQPDRAAWYASAMAPTDKTTLQGEVYRGETGLTLYYSTVAKPMRDALAQRAGQVSGIMASFLLRRHLCPNSYDWMTELLDRYDGHVVEFSAYSVPWGTLYPKFNTCFWEVRQY